MSGRNRVFTFILYPESMPENFIEIIEGDSDPRREIANVPFVLSPIHDKDVDKEGNPKKPHHHAMIMFAQPKSYSQVVDMVRCLGASHVSVVHSTQAMVRYFVHADQKDKAQYSKSDILAFNGADIEHLYEKNDKEINGLLSKLIKVVDENDISEYHQLVRLCMTDEFYEDYFSLISGRYQFFLLNYIKSKRFSQE